MSVRKLLKKAIDVVAPNFLHSRFINRMTEKEREIKLVPLLLKKGMMALDIGANRGLYVHHLLAITENVVAFEPLPQMQLALRRIYGNRIRLEAVALSDVPGVAELRFPEGNYSWATLEQSNDLSMSNSNRIVIQKTEIRTLDSYGFSNVGIIKIDVEGHEEAVLRGGLETLKKNAPSLIIEIEERHNAGSINRIAEILNELNYVGAFVASSKLHSLKEFSRERDQSITNVGIIGKTGHYINNFIFVPQTRYADFQTAADKLLAS